MLEQTITEQQLSRVIYSNTHSPQPDNEKSHNLSSQVEIL
jgi:hypothetical protein